MQKTSATVWTPVLCNVTSHEWPETKSGAYSNCRSSLLPILRLTAECIRLSNEISLSREVEHAEEAHYPCPSRPENDLLISSSFRDCIQFRRCASRCDGRGERRDTCDNGGTIRAVETRATLKDMQNFGRGRFVRGRHGGIETSGYQQKSIRSRRRTAQRKHGRRLEAVVPI